MFVTIEQQIWRLHESDWELSGDELAARFVERGQHSTVEDAMTQLAYTDVGSFIKTGVSAWERIK